MSSTSGSEGLIYNRITDTDMKISNISLGTAGFSTFYGNADENDCIKTVHKSVRCGINYIDTGPWYGHGKAEEILGKALGDIPRNRFYLATKVGRYAPEIDHMFDFSRSKTLWSIDNSLKRLNVAYVDVLQIHDIEFASMEILLNECLPALEEILISGKARYIGITGYPLNTLKEFILRTTPRFKFSTALCYSRLTLIDNSLLDYIQFFQDHRLSVINAAPQAMGLLTNRGPQNWHPASNQIKNYCENAAHYCKERNVELARLAMYDSITKNCGVTNLIGMNTENLLDSNLDVVQNGLNEIEMLTLHKVKEIFKKSNCTKSHWEGVELEKFKKKNYQGHILI